MFFDIVAVLVVTFFAALGMVDLSSWLLKNPFCKKIKYKNFIVAKVNSVKEEDLEAALRSLFAENDPKSTEIFLDCKEITPTAKEICENLRQRFEFSVFCNEEEVLTFFKDSLHGEKNIL